MARKTTKDDKPAKPSKAVAAQSDVTEAQPAPLAEGEVAVMKKPELLDAVVARTNVKKRDVKPAVEAALAVIGEALRDGSELYLPPLGKIRMVKAKDLDGGASVMTLKLRTPKHAAAGQSDT